MALRTRVKTARNNLMERLNAARAMTDASFALVRPEAIYSRPIAERHRLIFYIGHFETFDWNLMRATLFECPPLNSDFEKLFAFGIDPVEGGLPADMPSDWPSLDQVCRYRNRVRTTLDLELSRIDSAGDDILNVAIEHRLMHVETLAYMLHWLPQEQKIPQDGPVALLAPKVVPQMIEIPAGNATLGLPRHGSFGWDNEFVAHTVRVPTFAIDKYMVTNAGFMDFLNAGGYSDRSLWTDEDWRWKVHDGVCHPKFWVQDHGSWKVRTMFREIPLRDDWPVYVSHAEASAYARWAGKSLPTEAQWHRAAYGAPGGKESPFPWGNQVPSPQRGNFDFARWDPVSVGAHPKGESAYGVAGLLGNGWEWTSTRFAPFEGFEVFPFYPGYSANFFDGRHYVMKGGSSRTAACMLRRSFRNWFQPHYPHIYAGFRCVTAS